MSVMKKLSSLHTICLILAAVMLLSLFPWPYGYYVLVRFAAMVVFGYMAFSFYGEHRMQLAIVAGVLALLFQPFMKINLGREIWQVVDVIIGIGLIAFVVVDRKRKPTSSLRFGPTSSASSTAAAIASKWGSAGAYDVFISYSTKDKYDSHGNIIPGNVVSQVEDALTAAGISYWIDKKRLVGGVTYSAEIAKQIMNAKVFLYISSTASNASMWTMNEIATASAYGKTIIPFLADRTPYNPAIMIYIAGIHYIDYLSNPPRALADLIRAIKG